MNSSTTPRFRKSYAALPEQVRIAAKKQYRLWLQDARHPSLQFKKVGAFWSARVTDNYRSLALLRGDTYHWFWIGPHADYELLLKRGK